MTSGFLKPARFLVEVTHLRPFASGGVVFRDFVGAGWSGLVAGSP